VNGPRDYVASLTGLRGIAALLVFLFHYQYFNPDIRLDLHIPVVGYLLQLTMGLGWAGVDVFFVLSGFLLTLPFAQARQRGTQSPALGRYYQRRILRVFPAYYAQLAIITLGGAWFLTWRQLDGGDWLAHAFMAFNLGPNPVRPTVGVWWTLPVEFSFYLVLPLIAVLMQPKRWPWFVAASIAFSIAWRYWATRYLGGAEPFLLASHLPGSLPEFTLGASAALLTQRERVGNPPAPVAWKLDALFLAGVTAAVVWMWFAIAVHGLEYWGGHWSMLITPTVMGTCLGFSVFGLYQGSRLGRALLANPLVYFTGLVSYSLYLWHFVVMQQVPVIMGPAYESVTSLTRFLLMLCTVLAVAAVSYFLFERPFFRLRGRRSIGDK